MLVVFCLELPKRTVTGAAGCFLRAGLVQESVKNSPAQRPSLKFTKQSLFVQTLVLGAGGVVFGAPQANRHGCFIFWHCFGSEFLFLAPKRTVIGAHLPILIFAAS